MNADQIFAVKCALADLIGAYQAYKQLDMHVHDWGGHLQTIGELSKVLEDEIGSDALDALGLGFDEADNEEEIDITLNDGIDSINE